MQRDQAMRVEQKRATGPSFGTRMATKAAKAKEPAAWPLGNENPPGEGTATGEHQPRASHGRARPKAILRSETRPLVTRTPESIQRAAMRDSFRRTKGRMRSRPQPPPMSVSVKNTGTAHPGEPTACLRMDSSM